MLRLLPILLWFVFFPITVFGATGQISVLPQSPIQGEPIMITVENLGSDPSLVSITYDSKPLGVFMYRNKITALAPNDLKERVGKHLISVKHKNGSVLTKEITVLERKSYTAPLGIPQKLGGNTVQSQTNLVSSLSSENDALKNLTTKSTALWRKPFRYPLLTSVFGTSTKPVVTDEYGYSRQTGSYQIAHKGTDFRASEGTRVRAMNTGEVRLVRNFTIYGNTIVIDHGLGVMSFYMHLSSVNVKEGDRVVRGEIIGRSGSTGYAEHPHLHLTVRIDGVSIDPMKFMEFFQES
jgi:murein DD-endopeptidase MepM/ murein hydrolase activator NlpD